jgi:hypothetical protein
MKKKKGKFTNKIAECVTKYFTQITFGTVCWTGSGVTLSNMASYLLVL